MAIITTQRTNTTVGGPLRDLAIDASISGSTITYTELDNIYLIENRFLSPDDASFILSAPGGTITDYKITRFIKTDNLSDELPASVPNSSITDENDVTTQLTFADIDARETRSISQYSDGNYYCDASVAGDCGGVTLDEYNALISAGVDLIEVEDLPSNVV